MSYMAPILNLEAELAAASLAVSAGAWPKRFFEMDGTLFYEPPKSPKAVEDPLPLAVCQTFRVIARATDELSSKPGTMIRWTDTKGKEHDWLAPDTLLHDELRALPRALTERNFHVETGPAVASALNSLFSMLRKNVSATVTSFARAGWQAEGGAFLLPNGEVFGDQTAVYEHRALTRNRVSGTLAKWQAMVSDAVRGNSRLILSMSVAFTGPLLDLTGEDFAMFHLVGKSSKGKSTAAYVAGSVWGKPDRHDMIRSWRATDNGLEGSAAEATDTLLILDEMGQADPRIIEPTIYMLGNGVSKQRANLRGEARATRAWRIAALSTGERKADDATRSIGKRAAAGIDVRMINIPADAGGDLGVFDTCHGMPPAEFSLHVQRMAMASHGTAGRAFIDTLVEWRRTDPVGLAACIEGLLERFKQHVPLNADGQVQRVARKFALVAAAGELAALLEVTTLPEGAALDAARRCFEAWLATRDTQDGTQAKEDSDVISIVREHIEQFGASRFDKPVMGDLDRPANQRSGWLHDRHYYFAPSVFSNLVSPMPVGAALEALYNAGLVKCGAPSGSKKDYRTNLKVEGNSTMTVCIKPEILGG